MKSPVTPYSTPENKLNPAYFKPYPIFFAFYAFYCYLFFKYSSSNESPANPYPKLPVILFTVFKLPAKVFLKSDPAPYITPNPPSNGPLTNPSFGFYIRSSSPVPIFEKSPTGFPIKSKLPKSNKI